MNTKSPERHSDEALAELMLSRANVYAMLSRCYSSEIDESFAGELVEKFYFDSEDEELAIELAGMKRALDGFDKQGIEMLAVTFDRVFFGMGPIIAKHSFPYESVYTSPRGILMQEAYSQVVLAYREQRLSKDASFTEPEDHLAVELSFMATMCNRIHAFLCDGCEEAAAETARQQLAFANGHLLNWIGRFCADLEEASGGGFYAHLARFTLGFVSDDVELLEEMLG